MPSDSSDSRLHFLPVNINIEGKRILIIGGGRVGLHKATVLSRFTDGATIISPSFREGFEKLPFRLLQKAYEPTDLDGAFLVYICTENEELNRRIKQDAEQRRVLASVCDNPLLCDFTSPAICRQGDLLVAVSSDARDVRRSMRIRDVISDHFVLLESMATPEKSIYKGEK
ncbi:MAG: bifunctional precorrin-2 dehydrogenase/sirohydrochlorin ferrochelatase [Bacteroidaceae bacterium]|nr:bifunctional precorrin-2 dehydrogenase/sirohydrochlorin ferrochelatase [Bacteroidaceae bacterium]